MITRLRLKAIKRFRQAKSKMTQFKFDELNVIKTVKELYKDLENDNETAFFVLAVGCYNEATPHGTKPPDKKWLKKILGGYDDVLLYIYLNEVERKEQRAAEAINSAKNKAHEIKKAMSLWDRMTAQMCDIVTDNARLKAFRDAGVKKVQWHTQEDEKVCDKCNPLDGKIFDIDKAPPKAHPNCRCYYVPVIDKV